MRPFTLPRWIVWIGIVLILATGLIHFITAPDSFGETTYKGVLFVANGLGAIVAAVGIYRGSRTWGWGLGLVVAAGAFVAYVLSRTVGLPDLPAEPDAWFEPLGLASMIAEVGFILVALLALTRGAQGATNVERTVVSS